MITSYMIKRTALKSIRSKLDIAAFLCSNVCPNQDYEIPVSDTLALTLSTDKDNKVTCFTRKGNLKDPFLPAIQETTTLEEAISFIWRYRKYITATLLRD